ncbi:unnamed protein product, partial [Polarella glacialis]
LDAAKLACSPGLLDLTTCPADFTLVSFYKMFGYPTGLGALIVRHDAAPLLAPRSDLLRGPEGPFGPAYFAGGCVSAISANSSFAVARPNLSEWLERGTSHFLGIAALPSQLASLRSLASDRARCAHAQAVCREAYLRTTRLQHRSGAKLCVVFGRHKESNWREVQGPTMAMLVRYADGSPVPYGLVAQKAASRGIVLRTGCHCNSGACQRHLGLTDGDLRHFFASGKVCGDDLGVVDGRPTGVVRISFGHFSTLFDASCWATLLEEEFLDRLPLPEESAVPGVPEAARPRQTTVEGVPRPIGSGGLVVGLKVYPVKGCGPLRVRRWPLDPVTGALFLDRRWCLTVDNLPGSGARKSASSRLRPVSAKQAPGLTQVRLILRPGKGPAEPWALLLSAKGCPRTLELPLGEKDAELLRCSGAELDDTPFSYDGGGLLRSVGQEQSVGPAASGSGPAAAAAASVGVDAAGQWFEGLLGITKLRLVEAVDASAALAASPGSGEAPAALSAGSEAQVAGQTHFANAPSTLLLVSTASLREFGRVCGLSVPADRFRANLEVSFEVPYEEAEWPVGSAVVIGEKVVFEAAGRCVRCQMVDIDPEDAAARGPSLLAALATVQSGGGGGKGPTFGVLLRPSGGTHHAVETPPVLSLGMRVSTHLEDPVVEPSQVL